MEGWESIANNIYHLTLAICCIVVTVVYVRRNSERR